MATQPQDSEFVPLAKVSDIRPGEGKMIRPQAGPLRAKPLAVFNDNGNFHVLNYICPHMGGPLIEGTILDGVVTCPWHTWSFHAESGLPAGTGGHATHSYEVRVEGDDILVGWLKSPSSAR